MIIFDEPAFEEYKIINETQSEIEYYKQDQAANKLSNWIKVQAGENAIFVWDTRDIRSKRIKVKIGTQESTIQIDKCSESDKKSADDVGVQKNLH